MMKFFIMTVLFVLADTDRNVPSTTDCVVIKDIVYEKDILKTEVPSPYQLAIDHDTNTLFYSFTARSDEVFKIAYFSLKTGNYGIVSGIHGGFATTINSRRRIVYLGGEDGIYQFNYENESATNLNITTANIWQMFCKDGLYFTTYPEEKAYMYFKGGNVQEVPEVKGTKTMIIALDKNSNIYYSNANGIFMYDRAGHSTIHLSNLTANGFTADIDDNVYISTPVGIYYVNGSTKKMENVFEMDNIYGVAIESSGHIIYATENSIVRLVPSKRECLYEKRDTSNAVDHN